MTLKSTILIPILIRNTIETGNMMKSAIRKSLRLVVMTALISAPLCGPALSQNPSFVDRHIQQVSNDGFEVYTVYKSFFGRYVIVATQGNQRREMVIDQNNGIIIRDRVSPMNESQIASGKSSGNSGGDFGSQAVATEGGSPDIDDFGDEASVSLGDDTVSVSGSNTDFSGFDDGGDDIDGSDDGSADVGFAAE